MMRRVLFVAALAGAGCVEAPLLHDYKADPGPTLGTPPALPDPAPVVPPVVVGGEQPFSGIVKDYVTAAPVAGASISSYGLAPPLSGAAVADGTFSIQVPVQSVFWAKVSGAGLAATYDQVLTNNAPTTKDLYAVSQASVTAFATAFGKTQSPGCGIVIAYLVKNGAGAEGIGGVSLQSVTAEGPYFLDANKAAAADLDATSTSGRAVFFNVCPTGGGALTEGTAALVTVEDPNGTAPLTPIRAFPDGVTLVKINVDAPVVPPGPPVPTLDFATDIMPIFAQNGCAACHAPDGTAEATGLFFNEPAENVWNYLREGAYRVNLVDPALSYVLVRPLLEEPADHPNAAFESTENPGYQRLLQWIEEGAPYSPTNPTVPPVDVAVEFDTDVYPIFQLTGRGCAACHNATQLAGGVDYTAGALSVAQQIADQGLVDINYADRSKLLRNPYCGPDYCAADQYPETHPTRVFVSTDDPDYQTILQWILQGAIADLPPPPPPGEPLKTNVDFGSEVMIRLHARGCMGCHDATQTAGGLDLTGTPDDVLPRLLQVGENRVIPANVANSYLLTKPLGTRADVTHEGGKLIPNESDDFYLYVAGWVQEGGLADPPTPLTPVNFDTQIFPLFNTLTCTGCHGVAGGSGGLNLDGVIADVKANVQQRLTAYDGLPSTSEILTNPLAVYPNEAHGGGKLIQNTDYNYYKYVQRWINEGAQ